MIGNVRITSRHYFVLTGKLYDSEGNRRKWWSNSTLTNFQRNSRCLEDQYANFTFYGNKVWLTSCVKYFKISLYLLFAVPNSRTCDHQENFGVVDENRTHDLPHTRHQTFACLRRPVSFLLSSLSLWDQSCSAMLHMPELHTTVFVLLLQWILLRCESSNS